MANHKELSQWVLDNATALNLRVKKLDWIDRYFKGYSDIQVKIELASEVYEGRGSDVDADTALMKGVTEAIERFVCRENKISSIGVAGHYDLDLARENSRLEFIERSSISTHFNNKIGMRPISTAYQIVKIKGIGDINFKIHQLQMMSTKNTFGVFTLAEGIEHGLGGIMGASVALSLKLASEKSLIECLRNVCALSIEPLQAIKLEAFKKIEKPTSQQAQALLFDKSYCEKLLAILVKSSQQDLTLSFDNLKFINLTYESFQLKGCPLKFVRCLDENNNPAPDTEFVG